MVEFVAQRRGDDGAEEEGGAMGLGLPRRDFRTPVGRNSAAYCAILVLSGGLRFANPPYALRTRRRRIAILCFCDPRGL